MYVIDRKLKDRSPIVVKVHRLLDAERVLQCARDLACFISIFRVTAQRQVIEDRCRKFFDIADEGLVVKRKGVRSRCCAYAVGIPNLHSIQRRVAVDDRMSDRAAYTSASLETIGDGTTQMSLKDFAVCELDESPGIVGIAELGKGRIDRLLSHSHHAVDLFLGIGETLRHI